MGPLQLRGAGRGFPFPSSFTCKASLGVTLSSGAGLFHITFRGLRTGILIPWLHTALFLTTLISSVPHPARGRLGRRPPSGGRSRRTCCYVEQGSAQPPRRCFPTVLLAPRTPSGRSRRGFPAMDSLDRSRVARPGFTCPFPAHLPYPEQGGGGAPFNCGGRAGFPSPLSSPERLRSVPPIKRRGPVSHNVSRPPTGLIIPAEILHFS